MKNYSHANMIFVSQYPPEEFLHEGASSSVRCTPPQPGGSAMYTNEPYYDTNGTWFSSPGGPSYGGGPHSSAPYQNVHPNHQHYSMSPGIGHMDSPMGQVRHNFDEFLEDDSSDHMYFFLLLL